MTPLETGKGFVHTTSASPIGNSYLFTGRQIDEESGLYYFRARHYAPELRRFIQRDPLEYVDGPNPFAYCQCRGTVESDPSGLDSNEEVAGAFAAVAEEAATAGGTPGAGVYAVTYCTVLGMLNAIEALGDWDSLYRRLFEWGGGGGSGGGGGAPPTPGGDTQGGPTTDGGDSEQSDGSAEEKAPEQTDAQAKDPDAAAKEAEKKDAAYQAAQLANSYGVGISATTIMRWSKKGTVPTGGKGGKEHPKARKLEALWMRLQDSDSNVEQAAGENLEALFRAAMGWK